jgi:hypothetical protein
MSRGFVSPSNAFLEAARDEIQRRLNHMAPLDLAMSISALGRLRFSPGPFFYLPLVDHVIKKRLRRFSSPQALSLLANGLSNLQPPSGRGNPAHVVPAIATVALDNLQDYKPHELATLLAALGKLRGDRPDPAFLVVARDVVQVRAT